MADMSQEAPPSGWRSWTVGGRFVVPTTTQGRVALILAVVSLVPFGWLGILAVPVLLVLAWRKGDRGLLLILPLLVTLLLIFIVVAEFTIGHE